MPGLIAIERPYMCKSRFGLRVAVYENDGEC